MEHSISAMQNTHTFQFENLKQSVYMLCRSSLSLCNTNLSNTQVKWRRLVFTAVNFRVQLKAKHLTDERLLTAQQELWPMQLR